MNIFFSDAMGRLNNEVFINLTEEKLNVFKNDGNKTTFKDGALTWLFNIT